MLKQGIPWGIAAWIFFALFRHYPPHQVLAAISHVHLPAFIAVATGYFFYVLFMDTAGTAWIFSRFTRKVTMRDLLPARAATYPLSILNYGAGQAAFAYYIQRKRKIPVRDVFAVFMFIIAADIYWVITLAFIGSCIRHVEIGGVVLNPIVRTVALAAFAALILHIAFWRIGRKRFFTQLPGWSRLMGWLETKHLVRIFREATMVDYCRLALFRMPIHLMFPVAFYVVVLLFNAHVPFWQLFGSIPVVLLIGTIPITPGGLGTTNAAFVELLHPFLSVPTDVVGTISPRELIFAMSLLWMFANYFQKALFGVIFLARMSKDLRKSATVVIPA